MKLGEQADGWSGSSYQRWAKKSKRRMERRRAKRKPDCQPGYGRYRGYVT